VNKTKASNAMKSRITNQFLIGLCVLWLAACGGGGMDGPTQQGPAAGPASGTLDCIDRSTAVGIEGGGMRRIAGVISSIATDGTLLIGCLHISASSATVLIAGQPGTLSDLQVGEVVEVIGAINPESGVMQAVSISTRNVSAGVVDGRYIGTVTIGGQQLFGDAIVTVDGAVRLYVGGLYDAGGELQFTRPAGGSAQFVGHVASSSGGSGSASGLVIGQGCTDPQVVHLCSGVATGEMTFTISAVSGWAVDATLSGAVHVATSAGEETWLLDLGRWGNYYLMSASPGDMSGQYREELAEFATGDDTVLSISGSQLQFQSANSGCTGNGTLTPHLDGAFFVFDVTLDIGNCNATYARFNGRFEGLASATAGNVWDYDTVLRMWLSKPDGTEPQVALTMLAGLL
jgi:hypothetical protein